ISFLSFLNSNSTLTSLFFCTEPASTALYTLSLHDALPILPSRTAATTQARTVCCTVGNAASPKKPTSRRARRFSGLIATLQSARSEEHTSELQSRFDLVCRLLLEKKKNDVYVSRAPEYMRT